MNTNMTLVLEACKAVADYYGEGGYFNTDEVQIPEGMTENQLKGYLSQLKQAGKIRIFRDPESYFNACYVDWE